MKQDPICVGCKDSGLDLSGNDLAETMLKSCRTCGLSPNICLWYCEVGEIQRPNLFRSTYIPGEWVLNMNIAYNSPAMNHANRKQPIIDSNPLRHLDNVDG